MCKELAAIGAGFIAILVLACLLVLPRLAPVLSIFFSL